MPFAHDSFCIFKNNEEECDVMKLLGTMDVKDGELVIGGVRVSDLKEDYKTPLYIFDEEDFESRVNTFSNNFKSNNFKTNIIYASKAFTNLYIAKKVYDMGLCIDVVSGGELYTAIRAGVRADKIYFHGNNKLYEEIKYAAENNIGTFVIDNEYEYEILSKLSDSNSKMRVLLRVNPGIEAHTHEYIQTTKDDSKFGMSVFSKDTMEFIKKIVEDDNFDFAGIHCHIGSQVFEKDSFFKEADEMIDYAKKIEDKLNIVIKEINLGGGFGVYYTSEDNPFDLGEFLREYIKYIEAKLESSKLNPEIISIEPGRSLVNSSGSTLYTIGAIKKTSAGLPYVFVDGGMTDNPRPSLYQAKYDAAVANKMNSESKDNYRVAGKCCESGDILIKDVALSDPKPGDLLIIPSTGAYSYSMSSNYNRIERPAVVTVKDGKSKVIVKRESYEDLVRNDEL